MLGSGERSLRVKQRASHALSDSASAILSGTKIAENGLTEKKIVSRALQVDIEVQASIFPVRGEERTIGSAEPGRTGSTAFAELIGEVHPRQLMLEQATRKDIESRRGAWPASERAS